MKPKLAFALLAFTPACGDVVENEPAPFDTKGQDTGSTTGDSVPTTETAEDTSTSSVDPDTADPTTNDDEADDDESTTEPAESSSSTTGLDPEDCQAFFNCSMFCDEEPQCIDGCAVRYDVDIQACEDWKCDELSEDCFDDDLDACEQFADECTPNDSSSTSTTETGTDTTTETGTDSGTTTETGTDSGGTTAAT